jgi:hypothetical protein
MMLYQVVKLFGVWGRGGMLSEECIIKVSRNMVVGVARAWARAAVEIGNFG